MIPLVKTGLRLFLLCAATAISVPAQTFTTLFSFDGADGANPYSGLIQGIDGDFYGTTWEGGAYNAGAVFKTTPSGTVTTLHSFCAQSGCPDGSSPSAGLIQAPNGDFYGTTAYSGAHSAGTIFKITASRTLTTLYNFCAQNGCTDGADPYGGLIRAANGDLYGTTWSGYNDHGTVFKITPSGTLTTLYSFCAQGGCPDGSNPYAGLIQAPNGDFYGTSGGLGTLDRGTVFSITPSGTLTTLYRFCDQSCDAGYYPMSGLIQATNGVLYGTNLSGGAFGSGTVFKITPSGKLTTLYSFCAQSGCPDGDGPRAGLIQATDGNVYGTTEQGGAYGYGTVFKITAGGTLTTLYSFCVQSGCPDGEYPMAGLVQATNGDFYGTTQLGGVYGNGTVFSLSVGLGPFVTTLPKSGKVGSAVKILGTDLTGATSVTFNGVPATFKVVSATEITTSLPTGASTGTVQVVTPAGTLSSNVPFRVLP